MLDLEQGKLKIRHGKRPTHTFEEERDPGPATLDTEIRIAGLENSIRNLATQQIQNSNVIQYDSVAKRVGTLETQIASQGHNSDSNKLDYIQLQ